MGDQDVAAQPGGASVGSCPACTRAAPSVALFCPFCGTRLPKGAAGAGTTGRLAFWLRLAALVAVPAGLGTLILLVVIALPDMLASTGPYYDRTRQKRAVSDIRSVANAARSYATDYDVYPPVPAPTPGEEWSIVPLAQMRPLFSPQYLQEIPQKDPWGQPYLYGVTADGKHFFVLSSGSNGKRERAILPAKPVNTSCYESDIIFADDAFLQRPDGNQRRCGDAVVEKEVEGRP